MRPHMPHGGHYAHAHPSAGTPVPHVPMFRTYWRTPQQPPHAARQHLTFNDRRHVGELMSHYKAAICNMQGELENLNREAFERKAMMDNMAKLLEQFQHQEKQQVTVQAENTLKDWQKGEANKMQKEIKRVKEIAEELVGATEQEAEELQKELEDLGVLGSDGKFSKNAKKAVKGVVVEAVSNMQDQGVLPPSKDEGRKMLMDELTKLEERMNAEKEKELDLLRDEIDAKKDIINQQPTIIETKVAENNEVVKDKLQHEYQLALEQEMHQLCTWANDVIQEEVAKRMDLEMEDLEAYRKCLEQKVQQKMQSIPITTTSSGAPSGPSMSDIKSMISEIAQKITDDGVSHGVHSLNNMNKSITEGLTEEVRKEIGRMEEGMQHMLMNQEQLARKLGEESQILTNKIRAAGLVEEAEDSLRQARVNRLIEERVADAEAKVRDTLSRQYMQDLGREVASARDVCERQNKSTYQKLLEQAMQQHQRQLRHIREALKKEFDEKEEALEKETNRILEGKNQQIKSLNEEINALKDKHYKELQHKELMFSQEKNQLVSEMRCKHEISSMREEERMSQLQAEMALLVQNDSKHKMHLAEMGQSVAMTRDEASRLREQIMTKDNEFRKVLRELERALDEAHSKVPSTNEVICALQDMGREEQREVIRSIKWEPTLDDVATLLHQLDPREITYIVEQSLCGFYVPTIEFLKAKVDSSDKCIQEEIIKQLFELDLAVGLEAIQGMNSFTQHEIFQSLICALGLPCPPTIAHTDGFFPPQHPPCTSQDCGLEDKCDPYKYGTCFSAGPNPQYHSSPSVGYNGYPTTHVPCEPPMNSCDVARNESRCDVPICEDRAREENAYCEVHNTCDCGCHEKCFNGESHFDRRKVFVSYPQLIDELRCRTVQQIFNIIEECCPQFFEENTLMTLLGGKGYSFLCGSAEQQCNAQPDRWWMSMEKPQLQECIEQWYQHNPEEIKCVFRQFNIHPSTQEIVAALQRRTIQQLTELVFMLGQEKAHAIARDIIQGLPQEEAVMLLGTIHYHTGSHQLRPAPSAVPATARTGYRSSVHSHGIRIPANRINVRKHIHY